MALKLPFTSARPKGRAPSPIGDLAPWHDANPFRLPSTIHGSATWAWVTEMMQWGLYEERWDDAPGFPLGCSRFTTGAGLETSGVIRWPHEGHRLIVGSTGSGKFTSVIAPMLLSRSEQSFIVIDPKDGEAMSKTSAYRGQINLVGVLTPEATQDDFDDEGVGDRYLTLNPLDTLQVDDAGLVVAAKRLSDALIVRVEAKHMFWDEVAHRWMTATCIHVATSPQESERTLMRVQDIIAGGWPDEVLFAMLNNAQGAGIVQRAAREIEQNQDAGGEGSRLYMDIRAALLTALQFLDAPGVRASFATSNFDPTMLRTNAHPCTIYIVVGAQNLETYARWLRLTYSALVDLIARVKGREVAVVVDEFAALKRFDRVVQDLATLRGAGFRLHLAVQDLSQLQDLYGQGWQSIVGNCAIRQFLGVNDVFTADYVEKLLGQTTVEKPHAHHVMPWGNEGPGYWKSELVGRPLMGAAEITNMPREQQLIFMDGLSKPLRTFKAHYFANEPWASRATVSA